MTKLARWLITAMVLTIPAVARCAETGKSPPPIQAPADPITTLLPLAKAGDAEAMYRLGDIYSTHDNMQPFSEKARAEGIDWLEKAAAAGSVAAESRLGRIYANGDNFYPSGSSQPIVIPADEVKAAVWYEKAVAHGSADAEAGLAQLLMTGRNLPRDYGRAYILYKRAADQRDNNAQRALGLLFLYGAPAITYDDFHRRLVQAAKSGDSDAQWRLGELNLQTTGRANLRAARAWLKKSAAQGNAAGIYYLALSYQYDRVSQGVDMQLLRRSAELGFAPAQESWGMSAMGWRDDDPDNPQRVAWLKASADHDCAMAQFSLSDNYRLGHGVERDVVEALKWQLLASRTSLTEADAAADIMAAGLSEAQGTEGLSRAKAWLASHAGVSCG